MATKKENFWHELLSHIAVSLWLLLQAAFVNVTGIDQMTKMILLSLDGVLVIYCLHSCFLYCSGRHAARLKKGTNNVKQSTIGLEKTRDKNGK